MTSKLVVNTIESDTGISSVSFASSISMSSTSKFFFSAAGIDIGADTNINRPEAGVLAFNINSSEKARITSGGNVGVSTVTPAQKLHVFGNSGTTAISLGDNGTTEPYVLLEANATDNLSTLHSRGAHPLTFKINNSEKLRISSEGQVKLTGTNSGNHMTSFGTNVGGLTIDDVGGQHTGLEVSHGSNKVFLVASSNNSVYFSSYGTGSLIFEHTGGGGTRERLRIASDGKIGVNTPTPIGTLDVYDGTFVLSKPNASGGERNWRFVNNNVAAGNLGLQVSTAAGGSTFANLVEITKNGHIGINEGTPDRRLHLKDSGQIKLENTSTGGWAGLDFMVSSGTNNYDAYMGMMDSDGIFFIDNNSNGNDFTISREGIVSMPNQPMVRTRGGWSNVNWNGYKQISWSGEDEDIGGNFSSGVFTVPSGGAGRYVMTAQFIGPSSASNFVLWSFFKNTTALNPWVQVYAGSTNTETGAGTVAVTCAVGDTLRIAWHGTYVSPYNGGYNSFSIYKVH